jgi:hypothetical protein
LFTVWVKGLDVLPLNDPLTPYTAVIDATPAGNFLGVKPATPPLSSAVPIVAVPFLKVTDPVGVPLNSGVTVAVKVTDCPKVEGFSDETTDVVVLALLTVWDSAFDVLAEKFESPP